MMPTNEWLHSSLMKSLQPRSLNDTTYNLFDESLSSFFLWQKSTEHLNHIIFTIWTQKIIATSIKMTSHTNKHYIFHEKVVIPQDCNINNNIES